MDPHEMVVKNPYTHISIPRAHLRPDLGQQTWQHPSNPYGSAQRPAGLTYAGVPPIGPGDDIAHHCCCCPCCSCCHCPRFCRCHSCCCVVS
ncbi:cysteine-rich tail protein 1 isoform 2-T2 [Trichechus inunguis]